MQLPILVISCNFGRISYRFRDIKIKVANG